MLPVRMFIKSVQRYLLASATVCIIYSSCVFLDCLKTIRTKHRHLLQALSGVHGGRSELDPWLLGWLVTVEAFPTAQQLTFLHFL